MIDWITAHIAIPHKPLPMGRILKVTGDGEPEWETSVKLSVEGSYSMTIRLRSLDDATRGVLLEVDGSPLKFLQGHNVFGSNNWRGLLRGVVNKIAVEHPEYGLPLMHPSNAYDIDIRRLDITEMYDVGTDGEVGQVLHYLGNYARSRMGRGHPLTNQLLFQKGSRSWSLNFYNKYQELKKRSHQLPNNLPKRAQLIEYTKGKIRKEIRLLSREINRIESTFDTDEISKIYDKYSERITVSNSIEIDNGKIKELPKPARHALLAWQQGHEVQSYLDISQATFYRHRRAILKSFNIDIAIKRTDIPDRSNVIPFIRVIEMKQCPAIPEFAKGTDLYYDADENTKQLKLL